MRIAIDVEPEADRIGAREAGFEQSPHQRIMCGIAVGADAEDDRLEASLPKRSPGAAQAHDQGAGVRVDRGDAFSTTSRPSAIAAVNA
jgi:hypothetical protein